MRRSIDNRSPEYMLSYQEDVIKAHKTRVKELEDGLREIDDTLAEEGQPEQTWCRAKIATLIGGRPRIKHLKESKNV